MHIDHKPTVYRKDGFWFMRDPKVSAFPMAEGLTLAWCIKQNQKAVEHAA